MSKHTPEPWVFESEPSYYSEIFGSNGESVCTFVDDPSGVDVDRILSCVNACAGMEDPGKEIQRMRRQIHTLLSGLEQTLPALVEIMLSGDVGELLNDPVGHLRRVYGAVLEDKE